MMKKRKSLLKSETMCARYAFANIFRQKLIIFCKIMSITSVIATAGVGGAPL